MLTNAGLAGMIAHFEDEYVDIAIRQDSLQKVLGNWCAKQAAAGKGPNR